LVPAKRFDKDTYASEAFIREKSRSARKTLFVVTTGRRRTS
jgi:hypothetical protein